MFEGACTYDVCAGRGEGGPSKAGDSSDKLISCVSVRVARGKGVKKSENFADVKCTCPL